MYMYLKSAFMLAQANSAWKQLDSHCTNKQLRKQMMCVVLYATNDSSAS